MDQAAFKLSFPAFPNDEESIEKLCRLLVNDGTVNSTLWEKPKPGTLIQRHLSKQ
jgi:hypothetical protein